MPNELMKISGQVMVFNFEKVNMIENRQRVTSKKLVEVAFFLLFMEMKM